MAENPEVQKCGVCGEPMPPGEQMFKFHGYSGPCPKPPLPQAKPELGVFLNALDKERWQHAACLSIAEGSKFWDVPTLYDSPAMIAVRKLRSLYESMLRGYSKPGESNG